jgi:exosortase/archaeosortase family protein
VSKSFTAIDASPGIVALGRERLFAGLFFLATLNAVAGLAIKSVETQGWAGALTDLFGVSAVVWAALWAGIHILRGDPRHTELRTADPWMAAFAVLITILPFASASMVALSILATYGILTAGSSAAIRRSSIIFLAMSGALIWGRLVLAVFSRPLLDLDAIFVSTLLGSEHQGNMLWYQGQSTRLVVAPGCSSMQGMSLALLLWATINQLFEVRLDWKSSLWCLAALAVTILINVLRIGAMLIFPQHLEEIHTGWGFHLSMWATLIVVGLICLFGARREIFRRA